jgi:hypothetical protein
MKYEVAYICINAKGELVTKRKVFASPEKASAYLNKLEEKGTLYSVLGTREL